MIAAAGWVAYVSTAGGFRLVAHEAKVLANTTSAFAAEAIALEMALRWLASLAVR